MISKIKKFLKRGIIVPVLCAALVCTMSTAFAASKQKSSSFKGTYASGTIYVNATKNSSTGNWSFSASRTVSSVSNGYSVGSASYGSVDYSSYGNIAVTHPYVSMYNSLGTLLTYYYSGSIQFTFNGSTIN